MRFLSLIVLAIAVFGVAFGATYMLQDPKVDMSNYENVVPEYQAKIEKLLVATAILRSPYYKLRHGQALANLEALANEGEIAEALDTLFIYYAQPELFYCTKPDRSCPKTDDTIGRAETEQAYHWARKMDEKKKTAALIKLIRDARYAPIATEDDRIVLMLASEKDDRTALEAAAALAFHSLDRRYYSDNLLDEAEMWLRRARELEQTL